jgi:hypothetical protein
MPDEQIERMLSEAKRAFVVSEQMRPFYTVVQMVRRLGTQADAEEFTAMEQVIALALERFTEREKLASAVTAVLCQYLRSDGVSHPPSVQAIARRLAVAPGSVEDVLVRLVQRGAIEEVPPKGFILRRRRFRFLSFDIAVFMTTTPLS